MIQKFITLFKSNLAVALAEKTNWGRNDLLLVIEQAISKSLAEMLG